MISKESAQILLNLISNIQLPVADGSVESMQAMLKARDELRAILAGTAEVLTFSPDRTRDGLVSKGAK